MVASGSIRPLAVTSERGVAQHPPIAGPTPGGIQTPGIYP